MAFVVDASLAAAWFLLDEATPATDALRMAATGGAVAPSLFRIELLNVLLMAMRRGRTSETVLRLQIKQLAALPIIQRDPASEDLIVDLSLRHRLTAYDATYLALAIEVGLPLATLDKALAEAALAEGATIMGPLAVTPRAP
jgi:predicted nucleic acid-binding protein